MQITMSPLIEPPERHFLLLRHVCGGTSRFGKLYRENPEGEGLVAPHAVAPGAS